MAAPACFVVFIFWDFFFWDCILYGHMMILYRVVPRPRQGGSFETIDLATYKKSMADKKEFWDAEAMKCLSCEVHQRMKKMRLRCQWTEKTNEPINRWTSESRNQWEFLRFLGLWDPGWSWDLRCYQKASWREHCPNFIAFFATCCGACWPE